MKAIIIDDEPHCHELLHSLLSRFHSEVHVESSAYTVKEGIASIKKYKPQLVFLDIKLPDGSGFDVVEALQPLSFKVIFITAHDEYAIRAIRAGALDYMLKPVKKEVLKQALKRGFSSQASHNIPSQEQLELLKESIKLLEDNQLPSRIAVSTMDGIVYQQVDKIIRLEADGNYTHFYTQEAEDSFMASLNLGEFEDQFKSYANFMRVHRSHFVNLNYVHKFIRKDRLIHMKDGSEVKLSTPYQRDFLKIMAKV